jgi:tetratricopeptide (TPR) repeat protein
VLARALGDRSRLGRISLYLCDHYRRRGDADRAMAHGGVALDIATTVGDLELRTQTNLYLGQLHNALGDFPVARELLRRNLEALTGADLWRKFGQPTAVAVASRAYLVVVEGDLGEFAHAIPLGEEAVRIAEDGGQPFDVCDACLGLGSLYVKKGDFDKAIPLLERARQLCETWSIRLLLQRSLSTLGRAYALSGRIAEGLPLLEQAAEASAVLRGRSIGHSLWLIGLCEGYLLADRVDAARPLAERLLEVARSRSERAYEAHGLRLFGDVAALSCPPAVEEAERHYRDSIALAERLSMRPLAALGRLRLGELLAPTLPEAGRAGLETARRQFAEMDMTFWMRRAEEAIAGKLHTV